MLLRDIYFKTLSREVTKQFFSCRYRWFNFEGDRGISPTSNDPKLFWENMLLVNEFNDSIPLVDGLLWRYLRLVVVQDYDKGNGAWL